MGLQQKIVASVGEISRKLLLFGHILLSPVGNCFLCEGIQTSYKCYKHFCCNTMEYRFSFSFCSDNILFSHNVFFPSDKTENLNTELVVESLYCALNGMNSSISETSHQWGSPLSVGVLLATTRSNAIGIAVDALVTEWSLELAKFLEQAYK